MLIQVLSLVVRRSKPFGTLARADCWPDPRKKRLHRARAISAPWRKHRLEGCACIPAACRPGHFRARAEAATLFGGARSGAPNPRPGGASKKCTGPDRFWLGVCPSIAFSNATRRISRRSARAARRRSTRSPRGVSSVTVAASRSRSRKRSPERRTSTKALQASHFSRCSTTCSTARVVERRQAANHCQQDLLHEIVDVPFGDRLATEPMHDQWAINNTKVFPGPRIAGTRIPKSCFVGLHPSSRPP